MRRFKVDGGDPVSSDVLFGALFSNPWIGVREGLFSKGWDWSRAVRCPG
jgi:hypothetical protein